MMVGDKKKRGRPKKVRIKFIKRIPQEKKFVLCNGKFIANIKDLADVLGRLEDGTFAHHVNNERNDFSEWIKHIHQDHALAQKIQDIRERKKMQMTIYQHIAENLW